FTWQKVFACRRKPKNRLLWSGRERGWPLFELISRKGKQSAHRERTGSSLGSSDQRAIIFIEKSLSLCKRKVFSRNCTPPFRAIRLTKCTSNSDYWRTVKTFTPGCKKGPTSTSAATKPAWRKMSTS